MISASRVIVTTACLAASASSGLAASNPSRCSWQTEGWLTMSDAEFASACVDKAFGDSLEARLEALGYR